MNEAAISNAYDATKVFFQTPQERMDYLNRQMAIMDYNYGCSRQRSAASNAENNECAN